MGVKIFLGSCFSTAARSPELCTDIPPRSEIVRSARWAVDECARRGMTGSNPCSRLLGDIQKYCTEAPTPAKEPVSFEPRQEPARQELVGLIPAAPIPQAATATVEPEPEPMIKIERVWADNASQLYYSAKCKERGEKAYPIAKSLAIRQGFKPAPCN